MSKSFFETITEGQEAYVLDVDFDSNYDFDESLPRFATVKIVSVKPGLLNSKHKDITVEFDNGTTRTWSLVDTPDKQYIHLCHIYDRSSCKTLCKTREAVRESYDEIIHYFQNEYEELLKDNEEQRVEFLKQAKYFEQMSHCTIIDETKGENEGRSV